MKTENKPTDNVTYKSVVLFNTIIIVIMLSAALLLCPSNDGYYNQCSTYQLVDYYTYNLCGIYDLCGIIGLLIIGFILVTMYFLYHWFKELTNRDK